MTKTSKTIVFFGNERLATGVTTSAPVLRSLIKDGYQVSAVIANYEPSLSRSARDLEIAAIAQAHDIPVHLPRKISDVTHVIHQLKPDVGVLVAYGKIIPQSVINQFPYGIINVHPSLLPKHRGPTPIESVILSGEPETGVSIMQLEAAMDAGPVFTQQRHSLSGAESKQQLADDLAGIGSQLILDTLSAVLQGTASPKAQNSIAATYDKILTKADGIIDWTKPAGQLEREVRAFLEWPKSRATIAGKDVVITAAQVTTDNGTSGDILVKDKQLLVHCGKGSLRILRLIPAGKKEMTAESFINGHKNLLK